METNNFILFIKKKYNYLFDNLYVLNFFFINNNTIIIL